MSLTISLFSHFRPEAGRAVEGRQRQTLLPGSPLIGDGIYAGGVGWARVWGLGRGVPVGKGAGGKPPLAEFNRRFYQEVCVLELFLLDVSVA